MSISAYQLKKALLAPRTGLMRRREREQSGFIKSVLERHYYRPTIYRFIGATMENAHILHEGPLDADSLVLDVGAFDGSWAQQVLDRYQPTIYAFEPNPRSYARLAQRASTQAKLKPLDYGLGSADAALSISLKGLGSSIFDQPGREAQTPRAPVRILAVDRAWRELGLERVDLMKINIEGAEFDLLERMIACGLLERVECFLIQFHEWHPDAYRRRRRIRRELAKTHRLEWDYHFVWEKWSRSQGRDA